MMMRFLLMLAVVMFAAPALAASGAWQEGGLPDEPFRVRLVSAVTGVGSADTITAGLEFELPDGWKTYWRSPGDAGLPPEIDFGEGGSITRHEIFYPAPVRFSILGLDSYGYAKRIVYPLELELAEPGRPLAARARLNGLVCKDICIPVEETLTLDIPAGEPAPSVHARAIAEAASGVPGAGTARGVRLEGIAVAADGGSIRLAFSQGGNDGGGESGDGDGDVLTHFSGDIFIESDSIAGYGFAAPEFRNGVAHIRVSRFSDPHRPADALLGQNMTITAIGTAQGIGDFMLEAGAVVGDAASLGGGGFASLAVLLGMLGVAFTGGVILNVMPCVLPVLTLKLSSVVSQSGRERNAVRMGFLATAAGVVVSFLVLGVALLLARQAGFAVGWGVQFQQPAFLIAAAVAITVFALMVLDVVRLPVPQFASRIGRRMDGTVFRDFASGGLATLLATPCSAPFVGTAIAFGLTAPGGVLLMIFAAMGLGLASPWILVAAAPGWLGLLPRPGPWLGTLKKLLALGLVATAVWLMWVLAGHYSGGRERDPGNWLAWQPGLAENLVADGRTVFVDVTADWCITCQTNKALVLNTDAMTEYMESSDVVLVRADWTLPDDGIAAYLARFGRYGIPFNAVYGPAARGGIALPEILTINGVKAAVEAAGSIAAQDAIRKTDHGNQ